MNSETKEELDRLRELIKATDLKVITLLRERHELTLRVGYLKLENNLPVRDLAREEDLLKSLEARSQQLNLSTELVSKIYRIIIDHSVSSQEALSNQK